MRQHIHFATGNKGKVLSLQKALERASLDIEVVQHKLELIEIQADTSTSIAAFKAEQAFTILQEPVLVEDGGFYIDAFHGFPGPYTKYVLQTIGVEGILQLMRPLENKTCRFIQTVVYMESAEKTITCIDESLTGLLTEHMDENIREEAWSALDQFFIPQGSAHTLAALTDEDSERVHTLRKGKEVFQQLAEYLLQTEKMAVYTMVKTNEY